MRLVAAPLLMAVRAKQLRDCGVALVVRADLVATPGLVHLAAMEAPLAAAAAEVEPWLLLVAAQVEMVAQAA